MSHCLQPILSTMNDSIDCAVCGASAKPLETKSDSGIYLHGTFVSAMHRCANCGHVDMRPSPSDDQLMNFYGQDYLAQSASYRDAMADYANTGDAWWWDEISAHLGEERGRLSGLDYGCGLGAAVHNLRARHGLDIAGCDLSLPSVEFARNTLGNAHVHTIDEIEGLGRRFDYICASHVLEHMPDPRGFFLRMNRMLNPGGKLLLRFPNGAYFPAVADCFRPFDWVAFPMHLNYFTPSSVSRLLWQQGFEVLDMRCRDSAAQAGWMDRLTGLMDIELSRRLATQALMNRELVLAAVKSQGGNATCPFNRLDGGRIHRLASDWDARFSVHEIPRPGPHPAPLAEERLSPMARTDALTRTGSETYCIVRPDYVHPGDSVSPVVSFQTEGIGGVILRMDALLPDSRSAGIRIDVFAGGEPLFNCNVSAGLQRKFMAPVKTGGKPLRIAFSAVDRNAYCSCGIQLSIEEVYS